MKHILFYVTVSTCIFCSCVSTNYMSIDTRHPATVTVPPDASKILIVDNIPNSEPSPTRNPNAISIDSAKEIVISSLMEFMNQERYVDTVALYPHNTGIQGYQDRDIPLDRDMVSNMCVRENSDLVISFDEIDIVAEIERNPISGFSILKVKLGSLLRVYNSDGEPIAPPIVYSDSLYWNDMETWNGITYNIPPLNDAVKEISTKAAALLVGAFIPTWETEDRWYYSDNSASTKKTKTLLSENKWEDAAAIWREQFEKESKAKNKAKFASNVALAYENMDKLEDALQWIDTAFGLLDSKDGSELAFEVSKYRTILQNRVTELTKLQEQL